ncbi:MAG: N-acetylmuramoyl-L-alanine amidase [Phycisphaerales bacterium]|nr:N-acetylmuramoyl-L-alanine amidase [Phycisphaerales bacterium]
MNKLGSVQRITVHHEGMTRVEFTGISQVADRLDLVRRSHLQRMAAGDIGYHFVIDRAGRIWEGRPIEYQGAHVKYHNRRNLGVMVMGNFDVQSPSDAQMTSLEMFLRTARTHYDVAIDDVFTHQELGPTACPGRSLQRHMVEIRRDGTLA